MRLFVRILPILALILTAACGGRGEPELPTPLTERPALDPVPLPPSFVDAVERDTRTLTGEPGRDYWQQEVDYRIEVELDPEAARLQGQEAITYHNNSPDTLQVIFFHLYQNLFAEDAPRRRVVPITGGIEIERVAVAGVEATRLERGAAPPQAGAAYAIDHTVMALRLPRPLPPGKTIEMEVGWSFTVPPATAPRMGQEAHELYSIAQWYPQVATYDDLTGWDTWPYLADGEFYLEYGDFEVAITVPEGWIVAATGTLDNPDEVLPAQALERLERALQSDEVVRVVTEADLGAGRATRQAPGGQLTWRFTAEDVRDFAFSTSDRFLWDATRANVGQRRPIPVYAFYRPEAETWRRAAEYTRHSAEFHAARWHDYIYPQLTSVESHVGGMEYPMIIFVRAFSDAQRLYTVINHEVGHEWFPMMVGTNEHEYAWQDEGLTTYIENLATIDFYEGEFNPFLPEIDQYVRIAGTELEEPLMRAADLYRPGPARVIASYRKPGFMLRALEEIVGEETLHRGIAEYADRWLLKHPSPIDFFNTIEDVADRDLDWFWHPWWYTTAVFDQRIASVEIEPDDNGREETIRITIADAGGAPLPIDLVLTTATGGIRRLLVPVDVWLSGARTYTAEIELAGTAARVELDPERDFPDANREDNVWVRPGGRE